MPEIASDTTQLCETSVANTQVLGVQRGALLVSRRTAPDVCLFAQRCGREDAIGCGAAIVRAPGGWLVGDVDESQTRVVFQDGSVARYDRRCGAFTDAADRMYAVSGGVVAVTARDGVCIPVGADAPFQLAAARCRVAGIGTHGFLVSCPTAPLQTVSPVGVVESLSPPGHTLLGIDDADGSVAAVGPDVCYRWTPGGSVQECAFRADLWDLQYRDDALLVRGPEFDGVCLVDPLSADAVCSDGYSPMAIGFGHIAYVRDGTLFTRVTGDSREEIAILHGGITVLGEGQLGRAVGSHVWLLSPTDVAVRNGSMVAWLRWRE